MLRLNINNPLFIIYIWGATCFAVSLNNTNNTQDNVSDAVIMTKSFKRVCLVHLMNAEQRYKQLPIADPHTKSADMGCDLYAAYRPHPPSPLLSLKVDTYFTITRTVEGWVDLNTALTIPAASRWYSAEQFRTYVCMCVYMCNNFAGPCHKRTGL